MEGKQSPQEFLKKYEINCIPGSELSTGDIVVFYREGNLYPKKQIGDKHVIDSKTIDLIRFGVAYQTGDDRIHFISQDPEGTVWEHSDEKLPGYETNDWDYYGLRIPSKNPLYKDPQNPKPLRVIEAWLPIKQEIKTFTTE